MQDTGKAALASGVTSPVCAPPPPPLPKPQLGPSFPNMMFAIVLRVTHGNNKLEGHPSLVQGPAPWGPFFLSPELLGGFACSIWCLPGTSIYPGRSQGSATSSGTPVPTLWQVSSHLPRASHGFSSGSSSHGYPLSLAQLSTFTVSPGD